MAHMFDSKVELLASSANTSGAHGTVKCVTQVGKLSPSRLDTDLQKQLGADSLTVKQAKVTWKVLGFHNAL